MDCRVVVEAAIPVYDVETADEAVRIAISKTGGMLNPDLSYVEIEAAARSTPDGDARPPAFVVADEALVALELEMTVFNVEREEHARRIARKEIGQRLENIPLAVLSIEIIDSEDEPNVEDESAAEDGSNADGSEESTDGAGESADSEGMLPDFDELLEE